MISNLRALGIRYLRTGWTYKRLRAELGKTEYYNPQQLAEYQDAKFRAIIRHCSQHVPYYQDLFRQLGLKPEDFRTRADIEKLPFMNKQTVKDNFDRLISRSGIKSLAFPGYTSGSTGEPGKFLRDYHFINFENAAIWRHFNHHGYNTSMRRAVFTGRLIVPVENAGPPFWFFDKSENTLIFSSLHLSPQNVQAYIDEFLRFQPEVMNGYPSAIALFAELMEAKGVTYKLKAIFPGSETVFDYQRERIERVFQTHMYDWYGQQERVAAIGQCEHHTYHIMEDYSLVELQDFDGQTEIVGTHLENYKMPLLRYRTGDTVQRAQHSNMACPCGRNFRIVERIHGRMGQYIQTPDGRRISVVNYLMQQFQNIREAQFVQNHPEAITLLVVAGEGFGAEQQQRMLEISQSFISQSMRIDIQLVDAIPRTANGKFLCVVNNLPDNLSTNMLMQAELN